MSNTTEVVTITDFLLQRIAEDEANNDRLVRNEVERCRADGMPDLTEAEVRDYWADQAWWKRRLAECEAKRRIVERESTRLHEQWRRRAEEHMQTFEDWFAPPYGETLRDLATIYADHPDFRDEWRP